MGFDTSDDAGVFKVNDELALVQTLDFITPVVDDPYLYGQIAAANSLSDIFAMGATVQTVLNMVAYDSCHLTKEMLSDILRGGLDKVKESGGIVLGGHTVEDLEMKYGLAVTGYVHPQKILRNNTIKPGDKIILTKPLGMGVISTAIKAEMASKSAIDTAAFHMAYLNKKAAEIALEVGVNAMTDVTGFGLIGHMYEMTNKMASIEVDTDEIAIIKEAFEYASFGLFPSGSYNNMEHFKTKIKITNKNISDDKVMLMYDAQTSGGLMISVPGNKADILLSKLKSAGMEWCSIIAGVKDSTERKLYLG